MKKAFLNVLIFICIATFLVCAFILGRYLIASMQAEKTVEELKGDLVNGQPAMDVDNYAIRQEQLLKLKEINSDLVGWIYIPDTRVNYPVMHTPDDQDFYLHRDFFKNESRSGTLFLSAISDMDAPTDIIIIYGHMMKTGTMFGDLKKYDDKSFWEKHSGIRVDTLEEERNYEIFSVFKTAVDTGKTNEFRYYDYSDFQDETDFDSFIKRTREKQLFDTGLSPEYGDRMLLLSTCEYSQENGRLIVLAVEIKKEKDKS